MTLILVSDRDRFERFRTIVGLAPDQAQFKQLWAPLEPAEIQAAAGDILILGEMEQCQTVARRLEQAGAPADRLIGAAQPLELFEALQRAGAALPDPARAVEQLIAEDFLARPYYAYPLLLATVQAKRMGLRRLVAVEFGVWAGAGLLNMASLCGLLTRTHGIAFRVVGFDTGGGMPTPIGWPDHPEIWHEGDLKLPDTEALRRKLPDNAELILGDVAETVPAFMRELTAQAPLGFVALDLDFYSSSVAAMRIFDAPDQSVCLPAVPIYVDDSYVGITQHELSGEALAIHMHNLPNMRHLEAGDFASVRTLILKKQVRPRSAGRIWHHCIYFAHMCQHPNRSRMGEVKFAGLRHTRY